MTMLAVRGLRSGYGKIEVLHDVSLQIPPGEVTALLGPNGTGKSTLVLAVAGAVRPTSGRVLLGTEDLTKRRPERIRRAGVAVVPEGRRLLPELTVADNMRVATYALSKEEAALVEVKLALAGSLRRRRQMKRLTQAQLAAALGSSQSRVAKMEAAAPEVSIDLLMRSLLALGVTRRELAKVIGSPAKRSAA